MSERLHQKRKNVPSEETIFNFVKMITKRSSWYDGRDIVPEDTKNVYLLKEDGTFLGIGEVGRYDWFYQKSDEKGRSCSKTLHHFPPWSSKKYNMAVLNDDIVYFKPPEFDILTDIFKKKK